MTPALYAACHLAVHVIVPGGRVMRAGRASLHVLQLIGWRRAARLLRLPPLIWAVELVYGLVARNRPFFSRFMFRSEDGQ